MTLQAVLALLLLPIAVRADTPKHQASISTQLADFAWCLTFSPDGRTLAAGSVESTRLWEVGTWKVRTVLPFGGTSLAFSHDGRILAAASAAGEPNAEIVLWNVPEQKVKRILRTSGGRINAVALPPDGKTVAVGERLGLRVWDVVSGAELVKPGVFNTRVEALAFAPDGKTLAIGDIHGDITLWNVATRGKRSLLKGHTNEVCSLAYSPNGCTLAFGSPDSTIRLWDLCEGRELLQIDVDDHDVFRIALSPSGRLIAAASGGGTVKLWDAVRGQRLATLSSDKHSFSAAFSPDGALLAAGVEETIEIWRLR